MQAKRVSSSRVIQNSQIKLLFKILGAVGALVCLVIFAQRPSWPTPDKLLVILTFVFMIFGQAKEMLKRFFPFVGLLLTYESFRGFADNLGTRVNYLWMPWADRAIFNVLPTAWLQSHWWNGHVQWYDFAFYLFYMLHFIIPLGLAVIVWKIKDSFYWQYMTTYVTLSFAGFVTYTLFPAAPPWMASDKGLIEPITRVSSHVWSALGIHDFPSLYNKIAPNPVAAVPSLHAAYATLFVIMVYRLFGKKWAVLACVYPIMIYIGTVYQGEHYVIDAILGALYAAVAYFAVDWFWRRHIPRIKKSKLVILITQRTRHLVG